MFYLGLVLFVLGFAAYVAAALHIGHPDGGTYADIGSGVMLTATVLLLLRLTWLHKSSGAPKGGADADAPKSGYQA